MKETAQEQAETWVFWCRQAEHARNVQKQSLAQFVSHCTEKAKPIARRAYLSIQPVTEEETP